MSPLDAAAALAAGMRRVPTAEVVELPVADGGEGTGAVLERALGGRWLDASITDPLGRPIVARWLELPDGTAVVESAAAAGLPLLAPQERDPLHASTRGLGELLLAVLDTRPASLVVCVGGTATVDGGAAMRRVVGTRLPVETRVLCDVRNPLLGPRGAARVFGPQKGADARAVEALEARLAADPELQPYRDRAGAGAGGGLGAGLAALGAELVDGAETVLDLIGFDGRARGAALVVTGEGAVDRTTLEGKAPGAVQQRCRRLGVRCELFGGLVRDGIPAHPLSGRPQDARRDLVDLGERLVAAVA